MITTKTSVVAQLFRARVALTTAQAHLDALTGDPAARAWAEVMDAFYTRVREVPAGSTT